MPGKKIDIGFLINPFYLYSISFILAILFYQLQWSNQFPALSISLLFFMGLTFLILIPFGSKLNDYLKIRPNTEVPGKIFDFIFAVIVLLGIISIAVRGYVPILKSDFNYHRFGIRYLYFFFNSLSIFFSVHYFCIFLEHKKAKFLVYLIILIILLVAVYSRYALFLCLFSCLFVFVLFKRKLPVLYIVFAIIAFLASIYLFGYLGNKRSRFESSYILHDLGASSTYVKRSSDINLYMTYLYITSPLANLQKNIDHSKGFSNNNDLKEFVFYSLIPWNITSRLYDRVNLHSQDYSLVNKDLIVGTYYMRGFYNLGWTGMILLTLIFIGFVLFSTWISSKNPQFKMTSIALLSTVSSLLIFDNFMIKPDVLFMLFIYPFAFSKLQTLEYSLRKTLK